MPIIFKLCTASTGLIRRVSFGYVPPWGDLAGRISPLYAIPIEMLGVSYIDEDGDEIFVSSNDELQDYYRTYWYSASGRDRPETIKFTVYNLGPLSLKRHKSLPPPPDSSSSSADSHDSVQLPDPPQSPLVRTGAVRYSQRDSHWRDLRARHSPQSSIATRDPVFSHFNPNDYATRGIQSSREDLQLSTATGSSSQALSYENPAQRHSGGAHIDVSHLPSASSSHLTASSSTHEIPPSLRPGPERTSRPVSGIASLLSTLDERELEHILGQINEEAPEKGKGKVIYTPPPSSPSPYAKQPSDVGGELERSSTNITLEHFSMQETTVPCGICFDDEPEERIMLLEPCGHTFCKFCLQTYTRHKIKDRRYPIFCPTCLVENDGNVDPGLVSSSHIGKMDLSEEEEHIITELELASFAVSVHCRRCDRRMFIDKVQYEEDIIVTCPLPFCGHTWCRRCSQQIETIGERHECPGDGTTEFNKLMLSNGWKACPGCNVPVAKIDGCNHMTCITPGCNTHFCYRCGAMIIQSFISSEIHSAKAAHYANCDMYAAVVPRIPTPEPPPIRLDPPARGLRRLLRRVF